MEKKWESKKTDDRADRRLIRIVKINPRKPLQDLTRVFNAQSPTLDVDKDILDDC